MSARPTPPSGTGIGSFAWMACVSGPFGSCAQVNGIGLPVRGAQTSVPDPSLPPRVVFASSVAPTRVSSGRKRTRDDSLPGSRMAYSV
jgi:hypothetical protein